MTFFFVDANSIREITLSNSDEIGFDAAALTMRMFNVGDGEAILVSRGAAGVLFDGGSERRKRNTPLGRALLAYLAHANVTLGAFVATHPHVDHLNALATVLEGNTPPSLGTAAIFYHNDETMGAWLSDTLGARLDALKASGVLEVQAVAEVLAGRGLAGVQMLHFTDGRWNPRPAYKSIFTRVWYGFASFLFTGDAYVDYEEGLMSGPLSDLLDVDILKITHHGSEHGTGQAFVDAVDPRIAVASTSQDPGHRLEPEVRDRLEQGTEIFDTFTDGGDIIIRTDGQRRESGGQIGVVYEVRIERPGWFMGQQW